LMVEALCISSTLTMTKDFWIEIHQPQLILTSLNWLS
jgi:hypothetical protein